RSAADPASRCPTCSRTPPAASMTSPSCAPAGATGSSTRRRSMSCSAAASCRARRVWARGWFTASAPRAGRCPATSCCPTPPAPLAARQPLYATGFLPAVYQPTMLRGGPTPIRNLDLPPGVTLDQRRKTSRLIRDLNRAAGDDEDDLEARVRSYDLAF